MAATVAYMTANGKVNYRLPHRFTDWHDQKEFAFCIIWREEKIIHYSTSLKNNSDTSADQSEPMLIL